MERYGMLSFGAAIIVAFSGGADSVALLSFLNSIKEKYRLRIIAAHINHGIRGEEADRDENFAVDFCNGLGVEIKTLRVNIPEISRQSGESVEECARRIRYQFLQGIDDLSLIATAHTLSDSMETVLFNLTRGTALKGLCGIPPKRGRIIRPLIECTRSDIEEYCQKHSLNFVTDSTNKDITYSRNRIRQTVIPQLKIINPSLHNAFSRCVSSLKEDESFISLKAQEVILNARAKNGYLADFISEQHPALRKRVIACLIRENSGVMPLGKHIDLIDNILKTGGQVQVCDKCAARVKNNILSFVQPGSKPKSWSVEYKDSVIQTPLGDIETEIIDNIDNKNIQKINKHILDNCIDYDKITSNVFFRSRKSGDSFSQKGRNITKTLKKLFNEEKIPVEHRDNIIILCAQDEILWIDGFGPSEKAAVTDKTKKILLIKIRRPDIERGY
jgi:tRNA(Ile)-lysidine synthase